MTSIAKIPSALVVLPSAIIGMVVAVAFAFVADCVRLDNSASDLVDLADQDLLVLESRMAQLLSHRASLSDQTRAALDHHGLAHVPTERHAAFRTLVQAFETFDTVNQSSRFVDEARGIANRWSVSQQRHQAEIDKRNQYRRSRRGKIAAWWFPHPL